MRIQDRDRDILSWINGFGFVLSKEIQSKFFGNQQATSRRLVLLREAGFLEKKYVFIGEAPIYLCTKMGLNLIGDDLPLVQNLGLGTFKHDILLSKLSIDLEKKLDAKFIPERRLRQNPESYNVRNHIPDGLLITKEKTVSVELELSRKNKQRINRIMRDHSMNIEINEVWYFVSDDLLKDFILSEAKRAKFTSIKVFSI